MGIKETAIAVVIVTLLGGCAAFEKAEGFLKQIESKAYDAAALGVSEYCERSDSDIVLNERNQARRELRQRGTEGPAAPEAAVPGLDEQTAQGSGPVVRIWCQGEVVPAEVWNDLIKE